MATQKPIGAAPQQSGTPLPEIKAQPIDPEQAAAQVKTQATQATANVSDEVGKLTVPSEGGKPAVGKANVGQGVRSIAQIEADMDATRARLENTLTEIQTQLSPRNIMDREVARVRGVFVDEYGAVRPERVAMAGGAVVGTVVIIVGLRRLTR